MSIWAEIKKAINSNLDKPLDRKLDEMFTRPDEYLTRPFATEILIDSEVSTTSTSVMGYLLGSVTVPFDCTLYITARVYGHSSYATIVSIYKNNKQVKTSYVKTSSYTNVLFTIDALAGETYQVYFGTSGSITSYCNSCYAKKVGITNELIISDEKYQIGKEKTVLLNSTNTQVALQDCPRLDRCEFDYFGSGYAPHLITIDNVDYVDFLPPYCVMRIKY